MHDFGILTGRMERYGALDYIAFYDASGKEWHEAFAAQPVFDFYLAVDADGLVISMEPDPEHSQIGGYKILGISAAQTGGYTRGPGGSVYGKLWNGTAIVGPLVTAVEVGAERDRRLALGFDYDFADDRGVHHFDTTPQDMQGWDLVTKLKDVLLQSGDTTSKITIDTATGEVQVTAPEWNSILLYAALSFQQPLWQASFNLQKMAPIPADYATNAAYWPTGSQAA